VARAVRCLAAGFFVAIAATAACSLTTDLSGLAGADEAPAPDAALDVVDGAAPDAPLDASDATPPCKPDLTLDTPLTASLGSWSPRAVRNAGYPKIDAFLGNPAAVLFPVVDTTPVPIEPGNPDAGTTSAPERTTASSGIWLTSPVALRAFDVELEVHVRCTSSSSCADGFAFTWLDTTNAALLNDGGAGHIQGIPGGVGGGAVLLDDFHNDPDATDDPAVPALEIVKIEATKSVGAYPWVVANRPASFLGAWHRLGISVRGGAVSVRYDGGPALTATVPSVARGLVGITGGTGGETDAVAVRNVKGTFYSCMP